ncbi:MAG: hypothetical protein ACI9GW_003605 [Halieaceae bacterium]
MSSLQDQLLKAGLTDKKQLKKVKKEQSKLKNLQRHGNVATEEGVKELAQKALAEKSRRSRELAQQQNAQTEKKAVAAQIRQLIELNRQPRQGAEIPYNFTDGKLIKKVLVTQKMQVHLANGNLAIVKFGDYYELVAGSIADKISQRDAGTVVMRNDPSAVVVDEDDPYADYHIPDDLMW